MFVAPVCLCSLAQVGLPKHIYLACELPSLNRVKSWTGYDAIIEFHFILTACRDVTNTASFQGGRRLKSVGGHLAFLRQSRRAHRAFPDRLEYIRRVARVREDLPIRYG